jgi:hypothetical protein
MYRQVIFLHAYKIVTKTWNIVIKFDLFIGKILLHVYLAC